MFTGIIEELGKIKSLKLHNDSAKLVIDAQLVLENTVLGDSIAVNGVCLTVTELASSYFTVDIMAETLAKTNLGDLQKGSTVNLERALQLHSRLGGHLVSGHVDSTGTVQKISPVGIAHVYEIQTSASVLTYVLPKGSIAIDGISLTVIDVTSNAFTVSVIPHTAEHTTLGLKRIGNKVNLETDLIGKYVAKLLTRTQPETITLDFLAKHGFA